MLSFSPTPASIFTSWDNNHRPVVPSPLSSSPIRASSPLSPVHGNTLPQRQTQSSPLQPVTKSKSSKFAARPTRPNPVVRRREVAQESRRRNFLQKVWQNAHDKTWLRRDIEGQFLKTSWLDNLAHLSHGAPMLSEADIEDAMTFQEDQQPDDDDLIMEDEPGDQELDALVASFEEQQSASQQRPPSPTMSDAEYDDIFAELIAEETSRQTQSQESSMQMDTTDGNMDMH